jgi:hypothetical protein
VTVLTRWVTATLESALLGQAAFRFKEQLLVFTTANSANRSSITSHGFL